MRKFVRLFSLGMMVWAGVVVAALPAHAAKFRIGHHRHIMGSPTVVAWKMGYFDQLLGKGTYTVNRFTQGKLMREAILSNSLDVGGAADRPFVTSIAKGANLMGLGIANHYCKANHLLVRPDSKIQRVGGLRGRVLGIAKASGSFFVFRRFIAPAYNLKDDDYRVININSKDRVSALRAKSVDMIQLSNPAAAIAVQKGYARSVENYCKYASNIWVMIANGKTLKKRPHRFLQFVKAYVRAVKLLKENPDQYARSYWEYLRSKGGKISFALVRQSVNDLRFSFLPTETDIRWFIQMAEVLKSERKVRRIPAFDGKEGFDLQYLKEAMKAEGYN